MLSESTGTVSITGTRAGVTVSGGNATAVLDISGSTTTVIVKNVTIANGQAVTGGGIENAGILTLTNCAPSGNQSTGSAVAPTETSPEGGGAIVNEPGASLILNDSTLM